jgi:hypothetical protein
MLVRVRWFVLGALSSMGAMAFVAAQVKKARERLTPANLARGGARSLASLLDAAADRVAPASRQHS